MTKAFDVEPRPDGVMWLWSDLPLADDGENVRVIAQPLADGYWRLTDGATVLFHASNHGARIDAARLRTLSRSLPSGLMLNDAGELVIEPVSNNGLAYYASRHLSGQLVLSHAVSVASQSTRNRFENTLSNLLEATFGKDHVQKKARIPGASGHAIEIPFLLNFEAGRPLLMQYVSQKPDHSFDWSSIYGMNGRCADLRLAGYGDDQRLVVIEDIGADADVLGQATTALAESATVLRFSASPLWGASLANRLDRISH
ncbi:DUF1828 domain-containing protein [Laribacter hongkongensis]|uniref:DUF1828 domain-containing protein n=1 Tax=Laribacter hongkongensis TaxID=168471 RepID=UPI001EFC8C5F|nr:DUF1828 domain-containing protein [Laribacter hongkongensis]MCG9097813.1 DUF1828 domain-containing protein [Laribacter hongkongensis]MCG9123286.1 DUF1828 domain-containing protein [Laribacter hongkongensis]